MKIAIVGPSPVPYTIGGMEKFLWELTSQINLRTTCQAELIKLPSREKGFWELIDTYYEYWILDLLHFDMVLSTKYPSWMICHDNHINYMVHKLRGLYDTYHFTGMPLEVNCLSKYTSRLNNFMDISWENPDIKEFFQIYLEMKSHKNELSESETLFPGSLIRKIVHYLDKGALAPSKIRRYYAISETVAKRKDYLPPESKYSIAYPPPINSSINNSISYDDYFFTVSRLDGAKRVSLLIESMKQSSCKIPLVIAGTGPDEDVLKEMAGSDQRIKFLGYCNDSLIAQHYEGCLAVLYVPYEEDYGLVTVEAFLRKKPVITCLDSGGTNEFVVNEVNGFSVSPDTGNIAKAMEILENDRQRAIRMGNNGFLKVEKLTWDNFIKSVFPESNHKLSTITNIKPKMVVTTTFPIYPPLGGGQSRIYNLYKKLARYYDIEIISFTNSSENGFNQEIAPGLREIRIPKTQVHQEKEWEIERNIGIPVSDVVMPKLSELTPDYGAMLRKAVSGAEVIVVSHPYLLDEVLHAASQARIIYEAQDVEFDLKRNVLPKHAKSIIDDVYRIERMCCERGDLIMTCSVDDANRLQQLYELNSSKFVVVPNGVDVETIPFVTQQQRKLNKKQLGLENEKIVLFMGSWHPPNLEAANRVFEIAEELADIKFLLIGSQCLAFKGKDIPDNVGLLGVLEENEKNIVFGIVDLALNPMLSGSGTNLKMFDYMASGIPVISTEFGARGIEFTRDKEIIVASVDEMSEGISRAFQSTDEISANISAAARHLVEKKFDWGMIAEILEIELRSRRNSNTDFRS